MTFIKLGLLGPAGSGKDLFADILDNEHNIKKVAFADPMKRFAQKAFGFTDDQLWGPSQSRNQMIDISQEWWVNVIGHLNNAFFAEIFHHVLPEEIRNKGFLSLLDWFSNLRKTYPEKISARVVLQTLGTEWGRDVDPLLWARYAHATADLLRHSKTFYDRTEGVLGPKVGKRDASGIVIPDHRFSNEVNLTQDLGGYVIRIRRLKLEEKEVGISGHQSESEQKELPDEIFDLILEVEEFGDLESLKTKLGAVVQEKLWTQGRGTKIRLSYTS